MPARFILSVLSLIIIGAAACSSSTGKSFVPAMRGYHDPSKVLYILPERLLEISGIVHLKGDSVAAINDEDGELFFLDLKADSVRDYRFGGRGDYEELVIANDTFFVLDSDGDIFELDPATYKRKEIYKFKAAGRMEFESMVYLPEENKLVMITKEHRKKVPGVTAFSFDLATRSFDPEPFFELRYKDIFTRLENFDADFKPSAAALHPINGRLYLIASVGKLMIECSITGKLLKIYKINPNHFPQPEGISFADNGDMYISNEGLNGKATILKFPYIANP